ncbi:hypothetical protein OXPF_41150 [Oxobacter pfennigii]|uniref:Nitrogen regulatory protein P-II n=1 Tax=Oxobacter pfennigii TaxID=36849 RepID=A0A0P8WJJ7_9CLOT|nr:P-II family nitrogen regulator [Oxobacter pfennigii]KPU42330.1 hypothetical protein OXPF_41150 [Oxobacter pfennigii]
MEKHLNGKNHVIFFVIVNFGMGSKVLKEAKTLGVSGGTILLGTGTAKDHLLEVLGLDEIRKEVLLMIADKSIEGTVHEGLTAKFHLDKPNHGIAFSSPVSSFLCSNNCLYNNQSESRDINKMEYQAIFTIVERGLAETVVDASLSAGAEGGTIINARGSGIHEKGMLFNMTIEPEKEIVMTLIEKSKTDDVMLAIRKATNLDEPGNGIMFVIDVNKASGLPNGK